MLNPSLAEFAIVAIVGAVLFGSATAWSLIIAEYRRNGRVLEWAPRRPAPWNFPAVVIVGVGALMLQAGMAWFAHWLGWFASNGADKADLQPALIGGAVANVLIVILASAGLKAEFGAGKQDLGFTSPAQALRDAGVGLIAFLAIAPPMYLLQLGLVHLFPAQHPIIERVIAEQGDPTFFLTAFVPAVIIAPVAEEFLFRGVFQGWLESFEFAPRNATTDANDAEVGAAGAEIVAEALANEEASAVDAALKSTDNSVVDVATRPPGDNPYLAPSSADPWADDKARSDERPELRGLFGLRPGVFPTLVSSALFAAAHIGQGPAPITLFFLALALGYLRYRTHRLGPCVALHFFVNATSMAMLWLTVAAK